MRVLCVEDEVALREDIAEFLRLQSYEVDEAGNGVDALGRLAHTAYDAVLCDVRMPQMDGHALLNKVRENQRWAELPFVFLTAFGDSTDKIQAFREGCDNFITKPVNFEVLHQLLAAQIARAQHRYDSAKERHEVQTSHAVHAIGEALHRPIAESMAMIESFQKLKARPTPHAVERAFGKMHAKMNCHAQDLFSLIGAMQLDIEPRTVLSKEPTSAAELYELINNAFTQHADYPVRHRNGAQSVMLDRPLMQKAMTRLLRLTPKGKPLKETLQINLSASQMDIYITDDAKLIQGGNFMRVQPNTNLVAHSDVTAQRVIPLMFALQVTWAHDGQLAVKQEDDLLAIRLSLPR